MEAQKARSATALEARDASANGLVGRPIHREATTFLPQFQAAYLVRRHCLEADLASLLAAFIFGVRQ
jgi:hypothetical protein